MFDRRLDETWILIRFCKARLVAVTFPDVPIIAKAISIVHHQRPDIPILARARFASDVERLKRLGATAVINDELEAGRSIVDQAVVLQG